MSRDPLDNSGHLPPWLRGVPLPPRPADPPAPPPVAATPGEAEPLPEWLREMDSAQPATEESAPLPLWLRDDPAPVTPTSSAPSAPTTAPGEEPLPPWLIQEDTTQAAAETGGDEPLPDWLRDLSVEAPATPEPPVLPDWLQPSEAENSASPAPGSGEGAPEWLRDLSAEPQPAAHAPEIPEWLAAETADAAPAAPVHSEPEIPEWLAAETTDAAPEPHQPPLAPSQEAPATPPIELNWLSGIGSEAPGEESLDTAAPDWLRDTAPPTGPATPADDEDDLALTPFSLDDLGGDTPPAARGPEGAPPPAAPAPGWLSEIGGEAEDTAPAWLGESQAETGPAPGPQDEDVPAWLRGIAADDRAKPPAAPQVTEPAPSFGQQDDVPAWLREAVPAADETGFPPPPAAPTPPPDSSGGADLPDWLRLTGSDASPAQDAPALAPADELPSWLRPANDPSPATEPASEADTLPGLPGPADQPGSGSEPSADALPDWLRPADQVAPETPATTDAASGGFAASGAPDSSAPLSPAADDLPPWLRDERGVPLPTASQPGDAGLPEWLHGATAEASAPADAQLPGAEPARDAGRPATTSGFDWFDEEEQTPGAGEESKLLGGAELPAWLQAETEPKPDTTSVDTRSVDWLTRLGVQEDEAVATSAVAAPRLAPPRAPVRTAAQIEAAALLRQLAAEPYPAAPPAFERPSLPIWRRLGLERALYLLLLIVLVAGLVAPGLSAALRGTPTAPGVEAIASGIDNLTERDIVLVGYEWDARRVSELRPLERAVLDHLIEKRVKLVLVSTDPQGTLLLFDLRDRLTAEQYRQNGEGYLLLGYKPGGELALRTMAQDFTSTMRSDFAGGDATVSAIALGLDTNQPLTGLRDFAMTIVLADDASDVQAWMEQIRPATEATADAPGQPMLFLLPAEAEPIVQPYMAQPDVFHLAGYQGALAYQALRADEAGAEAIAVSAGQQRFATLALVAMLVLGAIAALISRATSVRSAP